METLKSYEQKAVEAITKGGNFNGKFYGKFIYVSNQKYQIDNHEAFLAALNNIPLMQAGFQVRSSQDIRNINRYGFDAIEM